jgi:hypothetical protein
VAFLADHFEGFVPSMNDGLAKQQAASYGDAACCSKMIDIP